MKKSFLILALALACFSAQANDDSAKAVTKAEKSLKIANKALKAVLVTYRANALPESRPGIMVEQTKWRQRVEKECAPESDGAANAGSAAEFEYAAELQCQADAAVMRTKALSAIKLLL